MAAADIVKYQFKPGQTGNPKGRPKGRGITDRLKEVLEADDGKVADVLMRVILKEAVQGDPKFCAMIWDRLEGKVAERVLIGPSQEMSPEMMNSTDVSYALGHEIIDEADIEEVGATEVRKIGAPSEDA